MLAPGCRGGFFIAIRPPHPTETASQPQPFHSLADAEARHSSDPGPGGLSLRSAPTTSSSALASRTEAPSASHPVAGRGSRPNHGAVGASLAPDSTLLSLRRTAGDGDGSSTSSSSDSRGAQELSDLHQNLGSLEQSVKESIDGQERALTGAQAAHCNFAVKIVVVGSLPLGMADTVGTAWNVGHGSDGHRAGGR